MQPQTPDSNTTPIANPEPLAPQPQPPAPKKHRALYVLAAFGVLAILGLCVLLGFWLRGLYVERQKNAAIERMETVQQGFVDLLSAKTLQQRAQYTDYRHRTNTYKIQSDFSNVRRPTTKGTISVEWDKLDKRPKQTLAFVAYKGANGSDQLYFRMIEGNELTDAPTDWYRGLQRDIRTLKAFENFWWFEYDKINSVYGTIVTGNYPDTSTRAKMVDVIRSNKAYVLSNCQESKTSTWCNGHLDPEGVREIDRLAGQSPGQGHTSSDIEEAKFTVWTNKDQTGLSRILFTHEAVSRTHPAGDTSHDYWGLNKPVDLAKPKDAKDAPILGGYRATIDTACSALCQKQLAEHEADRAAGRYY